MVKIYHNPRCSKSRETLALLEDKGLTPDVIKYLDTPPDAAELKKILKALGIGPRDLLRTGEAEYKTLNLANPDLSDTDLIDAMAAHPKLIQRPIVIHGKKAALGRPPAAVLDIL